MKPVFKIDVTSICSRWHLVCPAAERHVRDTARLTLAQAMASSSFASNVEVGVTLADDVEQQRLNREYRGQDVPTNVLAFPAWEPGTPVPPGAPLLLGDVVLAFETVAREAAEQGKPFTDHIRHMIVHGVLHLLGYDHRTRAEAAIMEPLETSILAELGVPNPYRDTMWLIEPEAV
jgi:probable rRNA maturation factor